MDWNTTIKGFKAYLQLERSLSPNSIDAYLRDIKKLHQFCIDIDDEKSTVRISPEKITYDDLLAFVSSIHKLGVSAHTQARIISA